MQYVQSIFKEIRKNQCNDFVTFKESILKLNEQQYNNQWQYQKKVYSFLKTLFNYLNKYQFAFFFTIFTQKIQNKTSQGYFQKIFQYIQLSQFRLDSFHQNLKIVLNQIYSYFYAASDILIMVKYLKNQNSKSHFIKNFDNQNIKKQYNVQISTDLSVRDLKLINILTKFQAFMQIMKSQNASNMTKKQEYNKLANQLIKIYPRNIFQEIMINKLKQLLQFPYVVNGLLTFKHCCAVYFNVHKFFILLETHFHEHKNYHWPIELPTIQKHVKKTIVGFLNTKGGIIYVGMKQQQNKVKPTGIALTRKQQSSFLQWLYDLCKTIYPQPQQQDILEDWRVFQQNLSNLNHKDNQSQFQYRINDYISVQFLSIVDGDTYLDVYEEKTDKSDIYKKLYMVKIKIKPGTKAETFHLLKDQKDGEIQCFKRKQATVTKLSLAEFMDFYQLRVHAFQAGEQLKGQIGNTCANCRFDLISTK